MKVAAVRAYLLLATAIFLFIAFAPSPPSPKSATHRKLQRRIGSHHAPFDPMVTKIIDRTTPAPHAERPAPDLPVYDVTATDLIFDDPEEYFSEDGEFDIEARLKILFPLLDRSPKDGVVSFKELEAWNLQQAMSLLIEKTDKELNANDKDDDRRISFAECKADYPSGDTDRNEGWWKKRFVSADLDGNGYLNFTEYMEFLHPEDSQHEKVQLWFLREKLREMDYDKDGKLNFQEFVDQAYENYKSNLEFEFGKDIAPTPEEVFRQFDLNNDRVLTEEELRPIIHYLHPGELAYARCYTRYLIREADQDNDGLLTLNEMLDRYPTFYSTVIMDSDYESDDDEDQHHDEL